MTATAAAADPFRQIELRHQQTAIAAALAAIERSEDVLAPTADDEAWTGPASDAFRIALAAVRLRFADAATSLRGAAAATAADLVEAQSQSQSQAPSLAVAGPQAMAAQALHSAERYQGLPGVAASARWSAGEAAGSARTTRQSAGGAGD
jgi:hypothetical protein